MRILLPFTVLFMCVISVSAQQKPHYTQYIFNNYLLNPAISGIENYTDVKIGYRNQWTGLNDAPVTSFFSVHAPLGKGFTNGNSTSFPQAGSNPANRSYLQTYMASEPHHGVGMNVVLDETGPLRYLDANATYAYHIGVSHNVNLSVGVSAGVSRISLDMNKITTESGFDPAIVDANNNKLKPNLGMGVWLYGPRYFAGFSAQQILGQPITFTDDPAYDQGKQVPHFFLTMGYKVFLGDDVAAIPSVMAKYVTPAPVSVDANIKLAFRDKFWLGGSYRKNDAFSAMAGFNVSHFFNLSYSYDFTTSDIRTVSDGSHEIVIGFLLNNRYKVTCPQKNW